MISDTVPHELQNLTFLEETIPQIGPKIKGSTGTDFYIYVYINIYIYIYIYSR